MKDLNNQECIEVLSNNYIGRIAFISKGIPEIIPITYYYDPDLNSIISYSAEGAKIKAMRQHKLVTFHVDEIQSLGRWKSILAHGKYEELSGVDAKHILRLFTEGVKKLLNEKNNTNVRYINEFSSKIENDKPSVIYRINILDLIGKER